MPVMDGWWNVDPFEWSILGILLVAQAVTLAGLGWSLFRPEKPHGRR